MSDKNVLASHDDSTDCTSFTSMRDAPVPMYIYIVCNVNAIVTRATA